LPNESEFRVLSIDGGGIRGLIPATILIELEKLIQTRRGDNMHLGDYFDFIAGTSTGGILTCLYLTPAINDPKRARFSAEDARKLYLDHGDKIFDRSVWKRLSSVNGLMDEKYDAAQLEETLKKYFSKLELSELIRPCLITGYDVRQYRPIFFTQQDADDPRSNYLLRDVARATSAAPTYFEPGMPENLDKIPNATPIVDGGVFANNPTACALVEALGKGRGKFNGVVPLEEIVVLSLGTGGSPATFTFSESKDWGLAEWARPLLGILMEGVSQTVDYQMRSLFKAIGRPDQYLRIDGLFGDYKNNLDIPGLKSEMDCSSRENMRRLCQFGEQLALNNSEQLKGFVERYF